MADQTMTKLDDRRGSLRHRHPRQHRAARGQPAAPAGGQREGDDQRGQGADERGHRQRRGQAEHQHEHRAHRRAGGDPEEVGVGQRVAGQGLHDGAGHREPGTGGGGGHHAGARPCQTIASWTRVSGSAGHPPRPTPAHRW